MRVQVDRDMVSRFVRAGAIGGGLGAILVSIGVGSSASFDDVWSIAVGAAFGAVAALILSRWLSDYLAAMDSIRARWIRELLGFAVFAALYAALALLGLALSYLIGFAPLPAVSKEALAGAGAGAAFGIAVWLARTSRQLRASAIADRSGMRPPAS